MPVDYSQGKVYKIVGNGKVYVGSTCERLLCIRFANHRRNYKCWKDGKNHYVSSFDCIADPDCYIELLELCPCGCVDELRKCEGKWIRDLDCVNKRVAGRTQKEQYEANREVKTKDMKIYYETNKEVITEKRKAYYDANKEAIYKNKKAYYEANKEAIKEKERVRYWENKTEE
jgi:hypothetical protein